MQRSITISAVRFGRSCVTSRAAIVLGLTLAVVSAAQAQPAISAVSGNLSNGQNLTVTGSGFGTKAQAAPLVWEDFSDGVANNLTVNGTINTTNTTDLRHPFSPRNGRANFKAAGPGHYYSYNNGTAAKWFTQYWIKLAANWHFGTTAYGDGDDGLANIKFWRLFPTGSRNFTNVDTVLHGFDGGAWKYAIEHQGFNDEHYIPGTSDFRDTFTTGTWHSVQVEYGENSAVGATNGVFRVWVNGRPILNLTNVLTNDSSDGSWVEKRPYVIGFYDSWSPSDAAVANMYAYYSDIYVDNAWSRVELGNASSYGTCTRRETQRPTAWSNGSITFTVTQGGFLNGQVAYLYVVDASGRVNAAGLPVSIGGGVVTPPSAPTGLRIVR